VLWRDFDRRANALAADLLAAGLGHQSKVAAYLYNGVEYFELYSAAFKAGLVPVNTNYRTGRKRSPTCSTTPTPRRLCSTHRWRHCWTRFAIGSSGEVVRGRTTAARDHRGLFRTNRWWRPGADRVIARGAVRRRPS